MDTYDTSKIRKLLKDHFSDEELNEFCFDHFREVFNAFGSSWSKPQKIQLLLGHCVAHLQTEKLLTLLKAKRPGPYELYFGDIRTEIKFRIPNVNINDLSAERLHELIEGFRFSLASELGVPVDKLEVVRIVPSGSVDITIRLPLFDAIRANQMSLSQMDSMGVATIPEITTDNWKRIFGTLDSGRVREPFFWRLSLAEQEMLIHSSQERLYRELQLLNLERQSISLSRSVSLRKVILQELQRTTELIIRVFREVQESRKQEREIRKIFKKILKDAEKLHGSASYYKLDTSMSQDDEKDSRSHE